MQRTLILHSSVDGHTVKICQRIKAVIEDGGNEAVTLAAIDDHHTLDLDVFDKIVVGASIRYGRHRQGVLDFVGSHLPLLAAKPSAFFSVNIVARKANRNTPQTNPYLRKFLRHTAWRPRVVEVFAGRLNYPQYGYVDRQMIRLIMKLTGGPTDPATVIEYTDWLAVDAFARRICAL